MSDEEDRNIPIVEFNTTKQDSDILVLFLPGLSGNRAQWDLVVPLLDTVKVDTAYGAPILPNKALEGASPTVVGLAEKMVDAIQSRAYASVVIAAHSVGSFVALAIADQLRTTHAVVLVNGGLATVAEFLDRPVRTFVRKPRTCFTALRLFALAGAPAPASLKKLIASNRIISRIILGDLVSDQGIDSEEKRRSLIENTGGVDVLKVLWINRHHWPQFKAYAGEIEADVRFLIGDRDPVNSEQDARLMAAKLRKASVQVLKGIGHAAPLETANAVAKTISEVVL